MYLVFDYHVNVFLARAHDLKLENLFSRVLRRTHAKKSFTEHRAIKLETSDITVTFQGSFWACSLFGKCFLLREFYVVRACQKNIHMIAED